MRRARLSPLTDLSSGDFVHMQVLFFMMIAFVYYYLRSCKHLRLACGVPFSPPFCYRSYEKSLCGSSTECTCLLYSICYKFNCYLIFSYSSKATREQGSLVQYISVTVYKFVVMSLARTIDTRI